jgi:hypothetical protein
MRSTKRNAVICSLAWQCLSAACSSTVVGADPANEMDAASQLDGADAPSDSSDVDTGTREGADAQEVWPCKGSQGMPLSCDSDLARPLTVTRFDAERGCFEPPTTVEGLCGVPTYCPGGSGELLCVIGPDGHVYIAYVLLGEELADGWHHSGGAVLDPTLTTDEEALCRQLGDARSDAGAQDPVVLGTSVVDGVHQVAPACASE